VNVDVVIVMGVAGSGKTTIGSLLSERLGCAFADSDDFHTRENKAKMSSGVPLTDADRMPWLQAIQRYVAERAAAGEKAVVACSALKASYRTMLDQAAPGKVAFVYLNISPELTATRLAHRHAHFMKANMLASQFATLEAPHAEEAIIVDASKTPPEIVDRIMDELSKS
jgi:gluconokinase